MPETWCFCASLVPFSAGITQGTPFKKHMYLLHTVVSSYEVEDIITLLHEVDDHVIVNMFRTQQFYGGFYRAPME